MLDTTLQAVDIKVVTEPVSETEVSLKLAPAKRWDLGLSGNVGATSSAADCDGLRLRTVAPDHRRAERAHERGVQHPDLAVGGDIYEPGKTLQQVRARPPFFSNKRELVVLDLPAVGRILATSPAYATAARRTLSRWRRRQKHG